MISASLTFHHPETIYHFLQKNVGPLCMVIKAGLAIINFAKPQHTQMALSKYHNTTLLGMSFKLKPFEEQDLQKQGKTEVINKITIQEPIMPFKIAEDNQPSTKLNEFTILMQQTMQIKDPQNIFQVVTKKSRKEIIEYVNSFAPLLQTAQLKKKQLINSHTNQTEQDKKVQEFVSYYSTGLTNITRSIKKQFKNLRRCCSKYGQQQENIDVDPQIKIDLLPKSNLINLAGFKNKIQYITPEGFQVKRIAALNEKQFICSLNGRQTNSLSFYNVGDEYSKMSLQIKEGAYGLLVLDNYILAGTVQGTIAFFNIKDLSVKQISMKLHNSLIYQLLAFRKRNQSYNVISLSTDNSLKIWNVVQQSFTDDASTLLFEQFLTLQDSSNKIISADVIDSSKIVYTKTNNIILHDCTSNKIIASQHTQCNILKVAKVNQHQTAAANERYLSFVDMRNNAKTSNYDITKDVRTLAVLSQYSVFYGCGDGEVGLIDRRVVSKTLWKTNTVHNSRIYDVCRIDNLVLTGDNVGQLASWMPSEMPSRNGIIAQYK